jgi:hypothetical protein
VTLDNVLLLIIAFIISCDKREGELVPEVKTIKLIENGIPPIRFFNFKKKSAPIHKLSRFYLFQNDKGIYHGVCKSNVVTCQNADFEHEKDACFEITISEDRIPQKQYDNLYAFGMALARKKGFEIKNCVFCTYYKNCFLDFWVNNSSSCEYSLVRQRVMNKKIPAYKHDKSLQTWSCHRYLIYEYLCQKIIDLFKHTPYWEWTINEKDS